MAPYFLRNLVPKHDPNVQSRGVIRGLRELTFIQWAMVFSGWFAWSCDAMDFFSVSLVVPQLVKPAPLGFDKPTSKLTTAVTLTLLFRPLGAVVFGFIADRFGRKWPLVWNLLICAVLQIGTSFTQNFSQFLAVRSLFGIAMGGIWGMATATALENIPVDLRGLFSGLLQEGYAFGYLFAAVINLGVVPKTSHSWRALFWVAAGFSVLAALVRAVLPESEIFVRAKQDRTSQLTASQKTKIFMRSVKEMLKEHWLRCIHGILVMSAFNFLSHGSQDLYPTYLQQDKLLSSRLATIATIIGNCGAIVGGAFAGYISQYIGRRLTICICCLTIGAWIPLWILPSTFPGLAAGAFLIQTGVQGAWGVVPIYLSELSPPAFRATYPGVMYQLGNMVSAASSQIEATGGDHSRTTVDGKNVPNLAQVQGIFIGIVAFFVILFVIIGPEAHGAQFEKHKVAFEEGAGHDSAMVDEDGDMEAGVGERASRDSPSVMDEKHTTREVEKV